MFIYYLTNLKSDSMRKFLFALSAVALISVWSCDKGSDSELKIENDGTVKNNGLAFGKEKNRSCATMKVLEEKLKKDHSLKAKMDKINEHAKAFVNGKKPSGTGGGKPGSGGGGGDTPTPHTGTVNIPVIVHVIYSNAQENISDAQIASQIRVLNDDYGAQNSDVDLVPTEFASLVSDIDINFNLVSVNRISSTRTSWGTNDAMKYASNGGADAWDANKYLNIWVCNIGGGILGYAQFPGGANATDGVVVGPNYFGDTGYLSSPFDEGRTATHEVGHWLNLRHIWGDGRCRADDYVADTPGSDRANYGCPTYPTVNCRSTDMTMNYMDYVDDACMFMFTNGQKDRMRALFATSGSKETFVQ